MTESDETPCWRPLKNAVRATPATNADPDFGTDPITREIAEGDAKRNVPMAVTAMDADGDTLRYEVSGGADMASFSINDRRPDHDED